MRKTRPCICDVRRLEYPMPAIRPNRSLDETQPNDVDSSKALRVECRRTIFGIKHKVENHAASSGIISNGRDPSDISICRLLLAGSLHSFINRHEY